MKISVWVAGQREAQRSLINALINNTDLRDANFALHPASHTSDTMGPDFDVIQLVVDSGFQIATLAFAFLCWRQEQPRPVRLVVDLDGTRRTLADEDLRDLPSALRALSGQPDPAKSRCVLVGVTDYPHLGDLPAVGQNCADLASTLTDPRIWGVPRDHCRQVLNPRTPREVLDAVTAAAEAAEDTLVVYFAGHGLSASGGEALHLCLPGAAPPGTAPGEPTGTVAWSSVRSIVLASPAARRVVILDCCYSGLALGERDPSASLLKSVKSEGVYTLTSATGDGLALAPRTEPHTAFTGRLIHVLRSPDEQAEFLTLDEVYHRVRDALGPGLPEPQRAGPAHLGTLPFFRTTRPPAARSTGGAPPEEGGKDARFWRRRPFLVGSGLLLSATLLATAVFWHDSGPKGPCSPHAMLLDYSDDLDKSVYEGAAIGGLSAIAMTGRTEAVALTDNEPGRLVRLSLGEGDDLDVEITRITPLLRSDGTPFGQDEIDGEGLVIQPGRALVSSEVGPSILVFDTSTGRQTGSLPVPPPFRERSGNTAVKNETLESLSVTPKGDHLYTGLENPLPRDGVYQGGNLLRILRYSAAAGQTFTADAQYAYKSDNGLVLTEIVALDTGRLLTLERGHVKGVGNTARIYQTTLTKHWDLSWKGSLRNEPKESFAKKTLLVDLGDCPPSGARAPQPQYNPLLDNIEGMTLGPMLPDGHRALYLVSDDNLSADQTTRVYKLDVRLHDDGT